MTFIPKSMGNIRESRSKQDQLLKVLSLVILTFFAVVTIIPFAWMIVTSLKPDLKAVYVFPPEWIPKPPSWGNYIEAWNSAPFDRYLVNSVIVTGSGVVLQVINACLSAYAFSRIEFRGRNIIFLLYLSVLMIPRQVTVIPNYIVLSRLGWINTYWALIVPSAATAFGTFLIRQAFLAIPSDIIDAAIVDGAGHFTILRKLMIPLSMPMIVTFAVLVFTWRWNDFFWVLIMTSSDTMRTLPVGLVAMRAGAEGGSQWHILMAATVIVVAPVMLLFILAQRAFVRGISRSGLAGF